MLRVAIVEDEAEYRAQIEKMIVQYAKEHQQQIKTTVFLDGKELIDNYEKEYDILLLDIEMPHLGGIDAAKIIRQSDKNVVIVFITMM